VRERCSDGQRLRCRPVLHPSFAGWLARCTGRTGWYCARGLRTMFERWHALTDNRRLVEMLCRLQSRGGQAGRMKAWSKAHGEFERA
jgi:hypothetical protein